MSRINLMFLRKSDTDYITSTVEDINRYLGSEKPNPQALRVAINHIIPTLNKLKAAGAPDDLIVSRDSNKKQNYTIGELRALIPTWQATENKIASKEQADYEAKWQPFTEVLKGDRLMLFNKHQLILQGLGGRMLDTPQAFKTTPIMAKYTIDQSGLVNRWNLTIWRFRGDKIIATQTKSGWGNDPPSSAFR